MCGIHGFAWRDEAAGRRMADAAAHRGPDGSGVWCDGRVTLAHNLLALTADPAQSAQPWHHADAVLVFNGEVYNHRDLRRLLAHKCRTEADTEVLAAGLREHGLDFLRRVDGMFALAWYDRAAGRLTLARDANGARPLYCGWMNGVPAFSSEIRSLLALGFPPVLSKAAFRHYYHAGLVTGPLTMFAGVNRLVPGEVVTFDLVNRTSTRDNLVTRPVPYAGPVDDLPDVLRTKLRQSVALTTGSPRQTGLFLSGGMDSAAVYYELVESLKTPPRSFTTRFVLPHARCPHNDDADAAAALTAAYRTKHREVVVGEAEWVADVAAAAAAMEEPRQGKSYPAYYACNRLLARFGCRVTLSGDGGDELLMGYKHQLATPYRTRVAALRPERPPPDPDLRLSLDRQMAYLDDWLPAAGLTGDAGNDFMYAESMTTLAEDFLVRNDKLGAAFGMEARFPMMCAPFRDFCRGVPSALKVGAGPGGWAVNNKILLRRAYEGRLPPAITGKKKTGWRAPTDDWLVGITSRPAVDGPVRQYVRETLRDPAVRELFGVTDADVEDRYLNNRDFGGRPKASGKPGVGPGMAAQKELFSVLMFAAWFKAFNVRTW